VKFEGLAKFVADKPDARAAAWARGAAKTLDEAVAYPPEVRYPTDA